MTSDEMRQIASQIQSRGVRRSLWSDSEIKTMAHLYAKGLPIRAIAKQLGRTEHSVHLQLHKLRHLEDKPRAKKQKRKPEIPPTIRRVGELDWGQNRCNI